MDFYYCNNKFYKKGVGTQILSRPSLKYAGAQNWDSLNLDNDFSKTELHKSFQFRQWVVLKKVEGSWRQDGPYSSKEIFHKIEIGEIRSDSMLWKKGFKKWEKSSETDTFRGLFQDIQFEANYELLDSVMEFKRGDVEQVEEDRILKNISFALRDFDFSNIPVHLEAKAIRAFPRRSTHIYRDLKNVR